MPPIDHKANDKKWQDRWAAANVFRAGSDTTKPKIYILDMFPYPSGAGLHVGHPEGYTATDIVARARRMQGWNVLHPMGWDAFGLPAEQYAIKNKVHPSRTTQEAVTNFKRQIQAIGLSYDWDREIDTTSPSYFKWTQWLFLRLFERGLAYEAQVAINWCPKDRTVLANDEVKEGRCWRCQTTVERREMRQWMVKITAYAQRLLDDLAGLDWPESTVAMQRNWIGRSEGAEIDFPTPAGPLKVFTTRPDTLWGATYMVLAPEHPLVESLTSDAQRDAVEAYRAQARLKSDLDRTDLAKEKTGVWTGASAINPATHLPIPIWIADYVLAGYGTGAIMAVPGHDSRDHEFAVKLGLPIVRVVSDEKGGELPFVDEGVAVNSGPLDGLRTPEAKARAIAWVVDEKLGKGAITYRLRDWIFSRQRYWGEPIPIVHCPTHGAVPVPMAELPLTLPAVESYEPSGTGESPLAAIATWVNTTCPTCGGPAKRETNTMPGSAASSWYFLRFIDPRNENAAFDPALERYWGPVDLYVGGPEHAVGHLLFARFCHKFLFDLGLVHTPEPFLKLRHQGMVLAHSYTDPSGNYHGYDEVLDASSDQPHLEDGTPLVKQIEKMSKAKLNVINPDDVISKYGADGLRLYEMFMGDFEASKPWDVEAINGIWRFLGRAWRVVDERDVDKTPGDPHERFRHKTIKDVTERLEAFKFNTAISSLMEYVSEILEAPTRTDAETLALLLSPFAPHLAEEMWERLGKPAFACTQAWPKFDPALAVESTIEIAVQVNGKLRGSFSIAPGASQDAMREAALQVPNVVAQMAGKTPKKIIVVPGKLVSVVV
jgi:leucyl-tRNA synthetase